MASEPRTPPAQPSLARRVLPKLALSLVLGGLFAWFAYSGGVPFFPPREGLERVRWWTVGAYALSLLVTHFFRASRWRFLIRPVRDDIPFRDVILLNWIGFFAIFALPLRLGELARPSLTKIRHGVSISVGLGTVAVERVVDGVVTSLCVVWALLAIPQVPTDDTIAKGLPYYGGLAVALFVVAFAGLVLFLWQRALAIRLIRGTLGRVSPRLGALIAEKIAGVADGVRSIARPRLALSFLAETLVYWGTNAAGMWLLGWGCGLDMGFGHAAAVMGILAIGILLPAGPGLFGNFQAFVLSGLRLYFAASVVSSQGVVFVFLLYATQAILITLAGVVPLYALKLSFRDLLRTSSDTPDEAAAA